MPPIERSSYRFLLLAPARAEFERVRRTVRASAKESGVQLISAEEAPNVGAAETVLSEVVRADLIIAAVSHAGSNVFYEVGLAQARVKDHFELQDAGVINDVKNIPGSFRLFSVAAGK